MSDQTKPIDHRFEVLTAILLGMIIFATAWSAYQSTLWGGIQTFLLRDSTSAGRQYSQLVVQQGQYVSMDVSMFMQYVNALHNNDTNLSEFYYERFRPELKTATEAWLETNPFENPDAPPHPFVMPEYQRKYAEEIKQFDDLSESKLEEAQQANQISDNYVMLTVIYASVLFIGAVMDKFSSRKLRMIVLIMGFAIFSVATAMLLTMPITTE